MKSIALESQRSSELPSVFVGYVSDFSTYTLPNVHLEGLLQKGGKFMIF